MVTTLEELAKETSAATIEERREAARKTGEAILKIVQQYPSLFPDDLTENLKGVAQTDHPENMYSTLSYILSTITKTTEDLIAVYRKVYDSPEYAEMKETVNVFEQKIFSQETAEIASSATKEQKEAATILFPDIADFAGTEADVATDKQENLTMMIVVAFAFPVIADVKEKWPDMADVPAIDIFNAMLSIPWEDGPQTELFAELTTTINEWAADFLNNAVAIRTIRALGIDKDESQPKDLLRIVSTPTEKLDVPLDIVNASVWRLLKKADKYGQVTINLDSGRKKEDNAAVLYGVNFSGLPDHILKRLTSFDKWVQNALATIYNNGSEYTTVTNIYRHMGGRSNPGKNDFKKINDSLTKLGTARVYLNNQQEVESPGYNYPSFVYDGPLVPFERVSLYADGVLTDSVVHLFREPPLFTFARERKQTTKIPTALLDIPISKTERNLTILDYLIDRTSHMKNRRSVPRKMLFEKIYERCNITTAKQKQRAPESIYKILDHFVKENWIIGYSKSKDGITIELEEDLLLPEGADN